MIRHGIVEIRSTCWECGKILVTKPGRHGSDFDSPASVTTAMLEAHEQAIEEHVCRTPRFCPTCGLTVDHVDGEREYVTTPEAAQYTAFPFKLRTENE